MSNIGTRMMADALLTVDKLSLAFEEKGGENVLYQEAGLQIQPGEVLGILGPSGSGKSVLAKAIFNSSPRQLRHTSGSIQFHSEKGNVQLFPAKRGRNHAVYGKEVSMVFQEPALAFNPVISIGAQLIEVVRKHQGLGKRQAAALIESLLPEFDLHGKGYLAKYPHQLSGGQLQRLMILMAVSNQPKLLIADEPTTSLDSVTQKQVLDLLLRLQSKGMALMVITHDVQVLKYLGARVLAVQEHNLVPVTPETITPELPVQQAPTAQTVLEVKDLDVRFENFVAVNQVSFALQKQEVLGIVGPSGCGKSTLSKAICQLLPYKGSVGPDYATGKVQMIFQHPGGALDPIQKIGSAVMEALKVAGVKPKSRRLEGAQELFKQVGIPLKFFDYRPFQLSGGLKQRACIARALATSPEILICDEAVSSLDAALKWQIAALLLRLAHEKGLSLVFISHDLALVNRICHRVLVMDQGEVVESFTTQEKLPEKGSKTLARLKEALL